MPTKAVHCRVCCRADCARSLCRCRQSPRPNPGSKSSPASHPNLSSLNCARDDKFGASDVGRHSLRREAKPGGKPHTLVAQTSHALSTNATSPQFVIPSAVEGSAVRLSPATNFYMSSSIGHAEEPCFQQEWQESDSWQRSGCYRDPRSSAHPMLELCRNLWRQKGAKQIPRLRSG